RSPPPAPDRAGSGGGDGAIREGGVRRAASACSCREEYRATVRSPITSGVIDAARERTDPAFIGRRPAGELQRRSFRCRSFALRLSCAASSSSTPLPVL